MFRGGYSGVDGRWRAKPIQDVQVGDEVAAYDPDSDTTQPRTVTNTFVHEQVETLVVRLEDGGTVETTAGHPFLTSDRGWTPAGHLGPGDHLHGPDGSWVTVATVEVTGKTCTVYNLEVEGLHTYHVRAGDTWTTVHNMCEKYIELAEQHITDSGTTVLDRYPGYGRHETRSVSGWGLGRCSKS
ncbi:hypothetical protein D9T14_12985 [Propionibacterium australiense]|nr:hypothetical protein D9T14_12985 [Propionibacterium australiense]